jgi:thioredoxin-like negative regulator of GroEL
VKARLLGEAGDVESARATLAAALKVNPHDASLLTAAGKLALQEKDFERAARHFEHGRKVAAFDGSWLAPLRVIYTQTGERDKLIDVLKEQVADDGDDLTARVELAKAYLADMKPESAAPLARDALMIDVTSVPAREAYLEALRALGKGDEAERFARRFAAN